jgi:hypothetical protein
MRVPEERQRIDSFHDRDFRAKAVGPRAHGIDQAVKRRGAFVFGVELRDRDRFALVPDASNIARGQPDRGVRRRSVVSDVANLVAWLLHQDASGRGSPHSPTAPPLGVAVLDAPDAVVLLDSCMQRGGRAALRAKARQRHGKLDGAKLAQVYDLALVGACTFLAERSRQGATSAGRSRAVRIELMNDRPLDSNRPHEIALGCMGMSGAYGRTDDAQSIAVFRRDRTRRDASGHGDFYGSGHNELLVAKADRRPPRPGPLSVKFGMLRGPDNRAWEASTRGPPR